MVVGSRMPRDLVGPLRFAFRSFLGECSRRQGSDGLFKAEAAIEVLCGEASALPQSGETAQTQVYDGFWEICCLELIEMCNLSGVSTLPGALVKRVDDNVGFSPRLLGEPPKAERFLF